MSQPRSRLREAIARVAPIAVVWAYTTYAYFPVTRTFFHHDDFHHLYDIANSHPFEFILKMNGFHLLLVPETVFWITYAVAGANPAPYMWSELLVHLLNCALLFAIAVRLMRRRWLAAACVIAWGTMLLQEGAVNAYSVLGQMLNAAFVLLAVLLIVRAGQDGSTSWPRAAVAGLSSIAASCSFGTGMAAAAVMPIVAFLLMPPCATRRRMVAALVGALPVIALLYFSVEAYNVAAFGAVRAVQVAPRSLDGVLRVAGFAAHLFAAGTCAFVLDGLFRPSLYPGVLSALVLAVTTAVVGLGLRAAPPADRRAFLALLLVCAAAYGMIAAGRAFVPLPLVELALWPRYHYMATAPLAAAIGIALAALARGLEAVAPLRHVVFAGWLAAVAVAHRFAPPIDNYDNFRTAVGSALAAMRATAAAAPPGAVVYLENRPFGTGNLLPEMRILFPGWFAVFAVFHGGEELEGRPVRFVEPDESIRTPARRGPLGSTLVVGPEEVPASDAPPR